MPRFLSDEWLADVAGTADELGGGTPAGGAVPGGDVIVQQVVDRPGGGTVTYHVVVGDRGVAVRPGAAPAPTVTFHQDYATARDIARGAVSAQEAFMSGRIRVTGDLARLVESQSALTRIDAVFQGVRGRTDYEDPRARAT